MHKYAILSAFKAMLYVAKMEGLEDELDEKYLKLEEMLESYEDVDVTDMIHNIESFYQAIDKTPYEKFEGDTE